MSDVCNIALVSTMRGAGKSSFVSVLTGQPAIASDLGQYMAYSSWVWDNRVCCRLVEVPVGTDVSSLRMHMHAVLYLVALPSIASAATPVEGVTAIVLTQCDCASDAETKLRRWPSGMPPVLCCSAKKEPDSVRRVMDSVLALLRPETGEKGCLW